MPDETVANIVRACLIYKRGTIILPKWSIGDLAGKCGFQRADKCYEHVPEGVLDKEGYKIPRDFNIQQIMASKQEDLV